MDNMGCGAELVKFVLLLFNVLCMICGATLGTLGALMVHDIKDVSNMQKMFTVNSVAIITLVLGALIFFISLLGCCGTLRGKPCQLRAYSVVMLLLFVCQVTLVIYVWTQYHEIRKHVTSIVQALWDHRNSVKPVMHKIEKQFKCCGVNGFMDYTKHFESVPPSCCGYSDDQMCLQVLYRKGCSQVFAELWESCAKIVKFGALIVSGVMLAASVFASYLAHKMRRSLEYTYE